MSGEDYIVIRPAPDLSPGALSSFSDGRWYDRSDFPESPGLPIGSVIGKWTAVPSGRFEVRDYDGAVAEVWEARPA